MKKTLKIIVVTLLLACVAATVNAKKPVTKKTAGKKAVVIGVSQFVEHPALNAVLWGFKDYLKENGVNVTYREYSAHGKIEQTGQVAAQIASDKPNLILTLGTPSAEACAKVYGKAPQLAHTPMLFSAVSDPEAAGLVVDSMHPGPHITGVSDQMSMEKHLEMIRRFLPQLKKLGVMYNGGEKNSVANVKRLKEAAAKRNITVVDAPVANSANVSRVAQSLVGKVDAVYVPTDNTVVSAIEAVVKVCEQNRLPLFSGDIDTVKRGAIAALGFDYFLHGRQTAIMARKILAGTKVETLPVEFQNDLSFTINPKAAERMGLAINKSELASATTVLK
ncbi:ABC transporter substrate-binding protein [Desulfopila sp. IMCC35006]|uniref:ABC transporter substrate-binding protein n=1 Tax=Desulfopila sp. IMCC35006 TaxID=2569542 RepID=UPI0010AD537A|nr:ABC transporter substrate-binding protein [Desulfopila sp. IMCC35006]TKB27118.1 ABC transporter substrate-binding protein [Desulfopila sp. IMCC35006]